jgi:D-alanine-D-alanine ligase
MTNRIRVAVVFGGRSNEHAVSCVSAGAVLRNLDPQRYEAVPIGITTAGTWMLSGADLSALAFRDHSLPEVDGTGTELLLATDPSRSGNLIPVDDPGAALGAVDVVFPVLHGPFGEDGTVQGMLELAGIPYVGPGVLASAAGMDKEFTKKLLAAEGLPIGTQVVLRPRDVTVTEADRERLGLPVFVKPARGGSSIGITKVTDWADLDAAIAAARAHDPKVIVEAGIVLVLVLCCFMELVYGCV